VACAGNSVFEELVERGVELSAGDRVKVPPPSMSDDLSAEDQMRIIRKVAPRYSPSLFLRDSKTAPFVLKMESIEDSNGQRTGQRIDLWFVAHGTLETLTDEEMLDEVEAPAKPKKAGDLPSEARSLTDDELRQRGLDVKSTPTWEDGFAYFNQALFERVQLSGVIYSVSASNPQSILSASTLDPRFADDRQLPNRWRSITREPGGKITFGDPQPYSGFGMYFKVTPLVDESGKRTGALFVECHVAFDEPKDWFGGANLIRSKMPLVIKDRVQDFRLELKRAEDRRASK
jgi:hypothetical protein